MKCHTEKMDDNKKIDIKLEALITEREAMIAENNQREILGQSMAYVDHDFRELAGRILELLK